MSDRMSFDEWFKEQHGNIPMTPAQRMAMLDHHESLRAQTDEMKRKLDDDAVMVARYTSALWAWQAAKP
jgi:hypothetical protein